MTRGRRHHGKAETAQIDTIALESITLAKPPALDRKDTDLALRNDLALKDDHPPENAPIRSINLNRRKEYRF